MVEKSAAFRQRRAADTARWRERLHRGAVQKHIEIAEPSKNLSPRAWRTTQSPGSRLASLQFNFGGSSSLRSVRDGASRHALQARKARRRPALEDPQTSGGG
jgi:hypothetical protein